MRFGSPDLEKALKKCRTDLQRTLLRRLDEELRHAEISANALAKAAKEKELELSQVSVSRILRGEQDPTIEKLNAISQVLGVPPWAFLTEDYTAEQRVFRTPNTSWARVAKLPGYPGWSEISQAKRKKSAR
jgi:transcriptional regulator with XRE-family HTH domain